MQSEEALEILGMELPANRKIHCVAPDHDERTPSLHVYPDDGGFYCFGCGRGGDGWDLLSLLTGKPVGQLMRERGAQLGGPRPRTRWQQLDELQGRAREATYTFHAACKRLHGLRKVAEYADRVDHLFDGLGFRRAFPEDTAPVDVARQVRDLETFYDQALKDLQVLGSPAMQSESIEGSLTIAPIGGT